MILDPTLSLAIDNCFASKRWTRPQDWMSVVRDLGLRLVEASADTECDPLYMGPEYTADWIAEVKRCSQRFGIEIVNLYSGHGTYATLGLAHTDPRVRERFRDKWIKAQADTAAGLGAGLGFFAHAINDAALQSPAEYEAVMRTLVLDLADVAEYARRLRLSSVGLEQMYSPNQPPWTIDGAASLLRRIFEVKQAPFYLTLDLGHMNGQQYFLRPSEAQIARWIDMRRAGEPCKGVWLGPAAAMDVFRLAVSGKCGRGEAVAHIRELMTHYDYLFASQRDGSVHEWLGALGCYAPIIHLQQSDGKTSPHWPFSSEYNRRGIIKGEEVLRSIDRAYEKQPDEGMPPPCDHIVLTLEPFIGTAGNSYDALEQIGESVAYWRQFVPRDGISLSEAMKLCAIA